MTAPAPFVSIVVVNWNGMDHTLRCVESLLRLRYERSEIVVVDNASVDGSAEAVEAKFPTVRVLRNATNVGFGPAVMRALPELRGEYVAVLNNDLDVDPDWLTRLVRSAVDGGYAAVASLIVFSDDPMHVNGAGDDQHYLGLGWPRHYREPVSAVPRSAHEVAFCPGGVTLYERRAFEEVGGFDDEFFVYVEDADLSWRLRLAGYRIAVEPSAVVRHVWEFHRNPRKLYHIERNRLLMLYKNWSNRALLLLLPALLVHEAAILVGAIVQGWGRLKLAAWRDALRAIPRVRAARARVVRRRSEYEVARAFSGGIHYREVSNALVRYVLNPILGGWWLLARPLLRVVGRRKTRGSPEKPSYAGPPVAEGGRRSP